MLKRSIKITFRLNAKEQQFIAKRVKKSGLSQEAFIRSLINGYVPKELPLKSRTIFP
jgi:predicted DNA binding CopG/RHH family protein